MKNIFSLLSHSISSLLNLTKRKKKSQQHKLTCLEKVSVDLAKGNHSMAARRLEGYLKYDPLNDVVLNNLASIFSAYGLDERAGRYWYLKTSKEPHEIEAVKEFEKSLGNDSTLILKKLITKNRFAYSRLKSEQIIILENLLYAVKAKEPKTPKFLLSLESHIAKRKNFKDV